MTQDVQTKLLKKRKNRKIFTIVALGFISSLAIGGVLVQAFGGWHTALAAENLCMGSTDNSCIGGNYLGRIENINTQTGQICGYAYNRKDPKAPVQIQMTVLDEHKKPVGNLGYISINPSVISQTCTTGSPQSSFSYYLPDSYRNKQYYLSSHVIDAKNKLSQERSFVNNMYPFKLTSQQQEISSNKQTNYQTNNSYSTSRANYNTSSSSQGSFDDISVGQDGIANFRGSAFDSSNPKNSTWVAFYSGAPKESGGKYLTTVSTFEGNSSGYISPSGQSSFNLQFPMNYFQETDPVIYAYIISSNQNSTLLSGSPKSFKIPSQFQTGQASVQNEINRIRDQIGRSLNTPNGTPAVTNPNISGSTQSNSGGSQTSRSTYSSDTGYNQYNYNYTYNNVQNLPNGTYKLNYENGNPNYIDLNSNPAMSAAIQKHANQNGTLAGSDYQLNILRRDNILYKQGDSWYLDATKLNSVNQSIR